MGALRQAEDGWFELRSEVIQARVNPEGMVLLLFPQDEPVLTPEEVENSGASPDPPDDLMFTVQMSNGSIFTGRNPRLQEGRLGLELSVGPSVVVDIASDAGGNVALTKPGEEIVTGNGVRILGWRNWPGRIPAAASALYARNLLTFLTTFWDKEAKAPKLPEDDEIVRGVMLTRGGQVVHPQLAPAKAACRACHLRAPEGDGVFSAYRV